MNVFKMLIFAVTTFMMTFSSVNTQVGGFAEGYSSDVPGVPAQLSWRAFTIYTGQDACASSPVPGKFKIRPTPITLTIGERIHRTHNTELIIEAYDQNGTFLSSVPIFISVLSPEETLKSRSDWDYMEATGPGEAELLITWYCADIERVEERVPVTVTAH